MWLVATHTLLKLVGDDAVHAGALDVRWECWIGRQYESTCSPTAFTDGGGLHHLFADGNAVELMQLVLKS